MSYVGYVMEELMHGRQAETERLAATYRQRVAVRDGRRAARRVRAVSADGTVRTASVPGGQAASATC